MRLPLLLIATLSVFTGVTAYAQNENNNWCFGSKAGVSFNTSPPSSFVSAMNTTETFVTMSDRATGKLLFYSDGQDAYDATHTVMQNGNDMGFSDLGTTAKGAVVVPLANDPDKYYVFSLQHSYTQPGDDTTRGVFGYSVVDMTLNNGLGGIIAGQKKIPVDTGYNEGMATVNDDCGNVWVLLSYRSKNEMHAYKVTPGGLLTTPVVSSVSHSTVQNCYTQMKVSTDRKKVVLAMPKTWNPFAVISLMDFDFTTGTFSNDINVTNNSYHGVEFSPDSKKLYACGFGGDVVQFDITVHNAATIRASETIIATASPSIDMQLGADGNIYLTPNGKGYLSSISNCNALAPGCVFTQNAITLNGTCKLGLPTRVVYPVYNSSKVVTSSFDTVICDGSVSLKLNGNSLGNAFLWSDGSQMPSLLASKAGTYWVVSSPDTGCTTYVDTFILKDRVDTALSVSDDVLCAGEPLLLESKFRQLGVNYKWDDNTTAADRTIYSGGTYWVNAKKECEVYIDTFHVREVNINLQLIEDTAICRGAMIILMPNPQRDGTQYVWSNGSTTPMITVDNEGLYSLKVLYDGCEEEVDTRVRFVQDININLGADTQICKKDVLHLPVSVDGDIESYEWSTGETSGQISINTNGLYTVIAKNKCDTIADSINVQTRICELFFPTAFTPNNDGVNDIIGLIGDIDNVSNYNLRIFNRWGQVVFLTEQPYSGWDGKFKGTTCDVGTYFYISEFEYLNDIEQMKGSFELIR